VSEFNPYRKWLGIPKEQTPPSHYQILGIPPDETDRDVINAAAVRQSMYVRNFQSGPHADAAARVLAEIEQAKIVLLDPEKRRTYDQTLTARAVTTIKPATDSEAGPQVHARPRRTHHSSPTRSIAIAITTGTIVAVIFLILWAMNKRSPDQQTQSQNATISRRATQDQKTTEKVPGEDTSIESVIGSRTTDQAQGKGVSGGIGSKRSVDNGAPMKMATFSPDASLIATAGCDGKVRIWNAETLQMEKQLSGVKTAAVGSVFVEATRLVVAGSDGTLQLWDEHSQGLIKQAKLDVEIRDVSDRTTNGFLFVGLPQGHIQRINVKDLASTEEMDMGVRTAWWITDIDVSPTQQILASTSDEGSVVLWDLESSSVAMKFRPPVDARELSFSPDGDTLAVGSKTGAVFLYETETWELIRRFELDSHAVASITFSPDGAYLLTGGVDWSLTVWNAKTGELVKRHWPGPGWIIAMQFSPDGRELLFARGGKSGKTLHVWGTDALFE